MALKLDINKLPIYVKIIIALVPSIALGVALYFVVVKPKEVEIKKLETKITEQKKEISDMQAKVARLDELRAEFKRLEKRLEELKEFLPEESEISTLLKQVSDLGIGSGLSIKSWRPRPRANHPSGIIFQVPFDVDVDGEFHSLGHFLGSLTRLNRIVNVTNLKIGIPVAGGKGGGTATILPVTINAATFTAVPDAKPADTAKK